MAEVHLGRDIRLDRDVAIKLRSDLARDPHFLSRFRREAQSAAGLTHPSIVAIFDSGQDGSPPRTAPVRWSPTSSWVCRGPHPAARPHRGGPAGPDEIRRVTQGVLDALSYSHKMGIVHRDIKPANVAITPAGAVKVMDFRHRPGHRRRRGDDDPDLGGHGDGPVPLARAGSGAKCRRPLGPVIPRGVCSSSSSPVGRRSSPRPRSRLRTSMSVSGPSHRRRWYQDCPRV